MKQIAMFGEQRYLISITALKSLDQHIPEATDWDKFQELLKIEIAGEPARILIGNLLQLFVPGLIIGPRSLILNERNVEPEQFQGFREALIDASGISAIPAGDGEEEYRPSDARAAEIAAKLKAGKKRRQVMRGGSGDMVARWCKALVLSLHFTPEEVGNLTLYQVISFVETYLSWESFDFLMKARLGGMTSNNEKIEHWLEKKERI